MIFNDRDKSLEKRIRNALKFEDYTDGRLTEEQIKEALKIKTKDDDERLDIEEVLSNHNTDKLGVCPLAGMVGG
jgi:hypothetical protein